MSNIKSKFSILIAILLLTSSSVVSEKKLPVFDDLVFPIMSPRISSNFGTRKHPIYKVSKHHNGLDLAAPRHSRIRSIASGVVVFSDKYKGYGNFIVIKHDNGLTSHYGHCHKLKVDIGSKVKSGQVIATVGSTGLSSGPHLHFEIRDNGKAMNPRNFLPGLNAEAKG